MTEVYSQRGVTVYRGDCLDVLRQIPSESISAICTDPPYGLSNLRPDAITAALVAWANGDRERVPNSRGFMGAEWDAFVPPPAVWDECLRVLKPGGHVVAFSGSRTYDLMGLSIRLAGFEVRDGIMWLNGGGMPKGKAQLKPAHEPMVLARKPFRGSMAANVAAHGTGGLNIDGCRVGMSEADRAAARVPQRATHGYSSLGEGHGRNGTRFEPARGGRWPANVILDEHAAAALDEQSGITKSPGTYTRSAVVENHVYGASNERPMQYGHGDSGGASRFFYCAKAPASERPKVDGQGWPTVKPLTLMRWVVRLVTPPGGTVLDPFAGTGTTLQAAEQEGMHAIGIERDELALRLIAARLGRAGDELDAPDDEAYLFDLPA